MKTNDKKTEEVKTENKKAVFTYTDKNSILAAIISKRSGSALKTSTVKGKGVYTVEDKKNGTSIVLVKALEKAGKKTVSGSALISILENKEFFVGIEEEVKKITGREYKNYTTLKSRLKKEVEAGRISSFNRA